MSKYKKIRELSAFVKVKLINGIRGPYGFCLQRKSKQVVGLLISFGLVASLSGDESEKFLPRGIEPKFIGGGGRCIFAAAMLQQFFSYEN